MLEKMKVESWIVNGNYNSTIKLRLQYCDTVIFLDYDTNACLKGIEERADIFKNRDETEKYINNMTKFKEQNALFYTFFKQKNIKPIIIKKKLKKFRDIYKKTNKTIDINSCFIV